MTIDYDNQEFDRALKNVWPKFNGRNVCTVDSNGHPLGGFGFMALKNNMISCFVLKLKPGWASRKLYSECLKFPFEKMGGIDVRAATSKDNTAAHNVCRKLSGTTLPSMPYTFMFSKQRCLELAKKYEQ